MKLTPDQLHRLIDEVAALAYRDFYEVGSILKACVRSGCYDWYFYRVVPIIQKRGYAGFAGLSAVLILLSEGG